MPYDSPGEDISREIPGQIATLNPIAALIKLLTQAMPTQMPQMPWQGGRGGFAEGGGPDDPGGSNLRAKMLQAQQLQRQGERAQY